MPITPAFWQAWQRGHRNLPAPNPATTASPATVTFPTTQLVTRVQIALGADLTQPSTTWQWADITNYVRQDLGISWSTGRPDGSGQVGYGRATLKLDNRDGRFSRRNPNSPYFGLLTRNTPIWVTVDAGSGVRDRIQMFVNEWPTRWSDMSATDSTVTIQCSGALRRLGQGGVVKSALKRTILGANQPTPLAYWPMEEGTDSTVVSSGLSGGSPMVGTPVFGAAMGGSDGSLDLAAIRDSGLSAAVTLPDANGFQVDFTVQTSGFAAAMLLHCGTIGPYLYNSRDGVNPPPDALPHHVSYRYVQAAGPSVLVTQYYDGVLQYADVAMGGQTLSSILTLTVVNRDGITAGGLCHVAVYAFADVGSPASRAGAATGFAGEMATVRIRRLCGEENVPVVCTSGVSVAMGVQSTDTFLNLLGECEAVDGGVRYEVNWGLGFQALNDRTNMPVSLALDFNQKHIAGTPEPADDDQRLKNRWTVSRTSGSSYVKELATGQTGTTLAGVYDGSATVNVQTDSQLGDQAGWRTNIGTVDEDRWPTIPLNFTRSTGLIDTWTTLPFGQRVTVSNPPSQMPPDQLDLVIEGFSEAWNPFNWTATINASPFSPYRIGTLAADTGDTSSTLLILTPDTLTLAADVNTTDVSWSIRSSPLWTTAAESFPRNIMWEGELITVTNCTGASSPQTWTVTRSVNGVTKAHTAGSTGRIYRPGVLAPA